MLGSFAKANGTEWSGTCKMRRELRHYEGEGSGRAMEAFPGR